jgi:hypothetical protein
MAVDFGLIRLVQGKTENRGQIIMLILRPSTSTAKFSSSYKKGGLIFSRL